MEPSMVLVVYLRQRAIHGVGRVLAAELTSTLTWLARHARAIHGVGRVLAAELTSTLTWLARHARAIHGVGRVLAAEISAMSSKTSTPYWRSYLDALDSEAPIDTQKYFSMVSSPFKLNQFELYSAVKPTLNVRSALDRWWVDVYKKMETSRDETIRRVGAMLRTQQGQDSLTGKLDTFWKEVEVHQAVEEDRLVNLRMTTDAKRDALMLKSRDGSDIFPTEDEDLKANEGVCTPPRKPIVYGDIPLVSDVFDQLSEADLILLNSATTWFKKLTASGIDQAIILMREERFPIAWIHDLLYDRLKLIRKGVQATWDENTYTSLWVNLDLMALYTGVDDLMTLVFANENHFSPSAWRRSLVRDHPNSKGTNVDGFYAGKDGMIDIVVENVGSPSCSNYTKKLEDERKCWRNTADALLERYYLSTGSFEVAKEYNVISMVIYGTNLYQVKKIFHGQYHTNKDAYLVKIMLHLKLCLVIKSVMERNQDVAKRFDETIDSLLPKDEQASFNLALHVTPSKTTKDV
ncbi:hypothetical protein KI688_011797 [Linnemannia hyalina]|uniref:Uncharacterized protein n=1 Tax=Linnemannia hyalina TaxID=64524 RepID=A0A9P8BWT3_9FUNG|nr:hypothetical protein KI688_011797 [Linnemannia hyalina]